MGQLKTRLCPVSPCVRISPPQRSFRAEVPRDVNVNVNVNVNVGVGVGVGVGRYRHILVSISTMRTTSASALRNASSSLQPTAPRASRIAPHSMADPRAMP
jgi:hypothetical protein